MRVSPIFTKTLHELRYGTRRIFHQGGMSSGKTVNILAALATLCSEEEPSGEEQVVTTVTAQSFPHLKGGALRDFETFIAPTFKGAIKSYHKTDHLYTFKTGMQMEFKVFENEMTAHGAKRRRLFVNEAPTFTEPIFFQLDSRSEQTIVDYNPSIRFWAHEKFIGREGNKLIISDHRHNPFLTEAKHREIESIYDFEKREGDYELWKVYARGLTGNVTGIIFPDWELIEDEDYPDDIDQQVYSIDFGYTNDPTAIVKHCKIGRTIFVKELAYETGIPAHQVVLILKANGFNPDSDVLYCERDPDSIRELKRLGVTYALGAKKGPGSVNAGINLIKTFRVKYTASSRNIHRERSLYIWEVDKETGKSINVPVDRNNHAMDAIRYGIYSRHLKDV